MGYYAKARNVKTGAVQERKAPAGFVPQVGSVVHFVTQNWVVYTGVETLINCTLAPPPPNAAAPAWRTDFVLPDYTPGADYSVAIPYNAATAGAGQAIDGYLATETLPGWLTLIQRTGDVPLLQGRAPATTTAVALVLIARQTGGLSTPKTFTIGAVATLAEIYAYVAFVPGSGFRVRIGGDNGTVLPRVTIYSAPAGWADLSEHEMRAWGALELGRNLKYEYNQYPTGPIGTYGFEFLHYGRTVYGSFTVTGQFSEQIVALTDTRPGSGGGNIGNFITQFTYDPVRLENEKRVTLLIRATSTPRVRLTGINAYTTGLVDAVLVEALSATINQYAYYFSNALPDGYYGAYAELIIEPGKNTAFSFMVGNGFVPPPTEYELLELHEGTPLNVGPISQVDYAHIVPGTGSAYFEIWAKLPTNFAIELDIRKSGESANYGLMDTGTYGNGFTKFAQSFEGLAGEVFTLSGKQVGSSTVLFSVTLPALPSSNAVARTTIFP